MNAKKINSNWKLEIHQLDVGQGDSALVLFKRKDVNGNFVVNKSILIDGGEGQINANYIQQYLANKLNDRPLDAVIITHFDQDHYQGIKLIMDDPNQNLIISDHTRFIVQNLNDVENKKGTGRQGIEKNNFFGNLSNHYTVYQTNNVLNRDIWGILNIPYPNGAPNINFIATNGYVLGSQPENLKDNVDLRNGARYYNPKNNFTKKSESGNQINQHSVACLVTLGNFVHYTAGDIGKIEEEDIGRWCIQNNIDFQSFKVSHHGSHNSTPSTNPNGNNQISFPSQIKARSAIISHDNAVFNGTSHPHQETINTLQNSNVNFVYMTNPANNKLLSDKFIIGTKDDLNYDRGTIKVSSYQSQANEDKFTINYKYNNVKTRDYYKNGSFINKADSVKNAMSSTVVTSLEDGKQKTNILLTKKEMKAFLDEDNKIKHLNVEKFTDATKNMYSQKQMYKKLHKRKEPIYQLSTTVQDQQIKFDVHGNGKHLLTKEYYPDTQINKLIARRTERGTSNDRKI